MKKYVSYALFLTALLTMPLAFTTGCAGHQQRTSTDYVNDQTTTARVKSDLLRDPIVNGNDVYVSTYQGDVQLSGFVASQEQKNRAGQIAGSVPGVAAVHNDIIVRTGR